MPYRPGMKGKMSLARSSYISERVASHKPVYALAFFPFDKTVVVAIVIGFASCEVGFATNTCFGVTKQHCFATNEVCFVTNKVCFVTNKHCFAAKQHSFLTKKLCFVTETLTNIDC